MKLRDLGEDALLARLIPGFTVNAGVVVAAGDDCAVVRFGRGSDTALLKTDCVVEGVHFTAATPPKDVGWKAMARPLSDFAAMAGTPRFALVTLVAPPRSTLAWTRGLYRGLCAAASRFDVSIVGGETSSTSGPTMISVSVAGDCPGGRYVLRSGGKPGDALFVTGKLGGSLRRKHLTFVPRIDEARWLADHAKLHAMMDLSDGLGADLPRLAVASGVGFELDESAIPRTRGCTVAEAIGDGEDFELLFAVEKNASERLMRAWKKRWKLPLTCIGRLTEPGPRRAMEGGYDHFKKRR